MASIRERNGRLQARVIRNGYPDEVRTFCSRSEAERWARGVEAAMDQGSFQGLGDAERTTLGEVIARYIAEVLPAKKGAAEDTIRLNALCRRPIAQTLMARLTPARTAAHRDERLREVSAGTVTRELAYLSSIINHARREWGIVINNPISSIKKPPAGPGRDRVLSVVEEMRLLVALAPSGRRNRWMEPLVVLALETAMRRGELLAWRWDGGNLPRRTATLLTSKNGYGRAVPLSTRAVNTLALLPSSTGAVFPVRQCAVAKAFEKGVVRAALGDLHFHDLRHTAITRLAEKVPNVVELSAISGHRSLAMLKRYYHPRAEDLALKLG
ncbi:MAG: phage integrase family protein [Spirosoma sp.]|nr:phage integrase family protein [Spirosoma sp.]